MYNEIFRKITSLTLLTILLASSAVIALPNAMPAAHAQVASHPNLFVSAENSQYSNYFAGPQVVQVIVSDPNINRLDQQFGEPIVTVAGKRLRMAQGTDGNWYGYFADRNQAELAAKTAPVSGQGLNFGYFCAPGDASTLRSGLSFTDTKGFTVARGFISGSTPSFTVNTGTTDYSTTPGTGVASPFQNNFPSGGSITNVCNFATSGALLTNTHIPATENVVRENKTLNANPSGYGASGLLSDAWPIIQLYDFSGFPQSVPVDYSAAGGDQIATLTFDRIPSQLISVTPDRTSYPENAQVFLTMNDPQLNVDPTEDDVWTWGANPSNNTAFYHAFDRNANLRADGNFSSATSIMANNGQNGIVTTGTPAMQNIIGNMSTNFMFNHNGKFTLTPQAQSIRIVDLQNFGREKLVCSTGLANQCISSTRGSPDAVQDKGLDLKAGSRMVTFAEQGGVNTGVFGDWDGSRNAGIVTLSPSEETGISSVYPAQGSIRGQSATFKYNDISGSIVGGFAFGSITVTPTNGTWPSGTRIPVTLTDMDENKNGKLTEHLNDYSASVDRITAMKIGTPFSINAGCGTNNAGCSDPSVFSSADVRSQLTVQPNGSRTITASGSNPAFGASTATDPDFGVDESFSNRVVPAFTTPAATSSVTLSTGSAVLVDTGASMQTLLNTIHNPNGGSNAATRFHGFNFLNFDLRSFTTLNNATGTPSAVQIYLVHAPVASTAFGADKVTSFFGTGYTLGGGAKAISLVNDTNMEDFVNLNGTTALSSTTASANPSGVVDKHGDFYIPGQVDNGSLVMQRIFAIPASDNVGFLYVFTAPSAITLPSTQLTSAGNLITGGLPMVTDIFSIGIIGDGTDNSQRINNGIYRWELEETGDNTGVFTGTTQYLMLNQLNLLDPATYTQLRTINHDVLFPAIQDMLQSEARAPQATYLDLGADGVPSQISAQQDIPTHTGTVSFDMKTYKVADTVTVTLNDQDLNTNNDLVVIYSTVPETKLAGSTTFDVATDTIGKAGLGTYSDGRAIGRLLDVQFGQQDIRWSNVQIPDATGTGSAAGGSCFNTDTDAGGSMSLSDSGFTLVETAAGSGIFTGTFEVPGFVCTSSGTVVANGLNMKVNYVDFRDQSGKLVEISDNAGIRGNTGSIKLDKAVYPVPFGGVDSVVGTGTTTNPASASFGSSSTLVGTSSVNGIFPLHRDLSGNGIITKGTTLTAGSSVQNFALGQGNVIVHARVNDPDYTLAPTGTNFIAAGVFCDTGECSATHQNGPVAFQISRQGQSVLLATAGGPAATNGTIYDLGTLPLPKADDPIWKNIRDLGPMAEISPAAGIFQADLPIELTDGPRGQDCPTVDNFDSINGTTGFLARNDANTGGTIVGTLTHDSGEYGRFTTAHTTAINGDSSTNNYCVRQGDVLTVTYLDTSDASGNRQTVTDSATFDLRNGVLQSDKSVYIIGSDMILTLVDPDFNLDSQTAETLPLDLIEWDSHAYKGTMGPLADKSFGAGTFASFDAKPSTFVETGKDTGIYQAVIKIPKQITNTLLERGEQINLEYTDWGPAGSKTVGANNQDIELTIYTSNFGATVELDQKVYTWTDRVYMTVVAPDHNFDPNLIDTIGNNGGEDLVTVSTRGHSIFYKLAETGVDTGIFTGYVILTGDASINPSTAGTNGQSSGGGVDGQGEEPTGITGNGGTNSCTQSVPCGPTDGFLQAEDSDGVSVSFEFTRDQTVTGSALIRWNIGEISWLQSSYPANGQGVLQIVDPDMNLNPKAVDKFNTNVWSDSDSGGIQLTMTETGQDTGIFQGTVYFTTNFGSSGNRLHVSEGDTVTGEYKDRTLPPPYTPADQLRLTSTTFIGTIVPPLERAPATNPRIVDSFGNAINGTVKVGQQIQVTADLANGQNRDQPFAYLVQIQDANGVTVSLSWITGTLSAGQSLNPAQSWTPSAAGTYTAQIFVWQSIDNPNALSPPLSTTINVQ